MGALKIITGFRYYLLTDSATSRGLLVSNDEDDSTSLAGRSPRVSIEEEALCKKVPTSLFFLT
jgi:hypothetical protein